jgi:hypothetical protein
MSYCIVVANPTIATSAATTTTTTMTDIIINRNTDVELICYHQCHICGIIFDCDNSRQKCRLPFHNSKIKCSLCSNRSPLF